jgi:hypothetical protein
MRVSLYLPVLADDRGVAAAGKTRLGEAPYDRYNFSSLTIHKAATGGRAAAR